MAPIPPSELTPDQLAAILDDVRDNAGTADGSVRKVAARHGISHSTLCRLAKANGLGDAWADGNARTALAAASRATTSADRRADLQTGLLDDIAELRGRLFDDVPIWAGGIGGIEKSTIASGPADWRNTLTAIGIAADKVIALARLEAENSGSGQATGLLDAFEQSLRAARERREQQSET